MGRSQRHMIYVQNAPASGEASAQGQPAPGFLLQAGAPPPALEREQYGAELQGVENITVVEGAPGGPLQGSTIIAAVPESFDPGPGPEPEPDEPTIGSLSPTSVPVNTPVQVTITGTGFNEMSTVEANGSGLISAFVSETEMTVDIPSFPDAQTLAIVVVTDGVESAPTNFEVTAAEEEPGPAPPEPEAETREPGPFNILAIDNDEQGLVMVVDGGEYVVGDQVTIEATGNTSVNGEWNIVAVDGLNIVVDNPYELTTIIENKGRVTINAGA